MPERTCVYCDGEHSTVEHSFARDQRQPAMPERTPCTAASGTLRCDLDADGHRVHRVGAVMWWLDDHATPPSAEPERRDTTDAGDIAQVLARVMSICAAHAADARLSDEQRKRVIEDHARLRTLRETVEIEREEGKLWRMAFTAFAVAERDPATFARMFSRWAQEYRALTAARSGETAR